MSKTKFPKKLLVTKSTDVSDDPILIAHETPEDIGEEDADEPVAIYELVSVGKFRCEKSVEARPIIKPTYGLKR